MCKQIILSSDFLWILYFPWPVPTPRFTISVWISHSSFLSVQLSFFTGFLGFSSQSLTWVLSLSKLKVINPFSTSPPLPHPLCGCSQLQFSLCAPSFVPAFWKDSLHRYLPVLSATWAFLSPVITFVSHSAPVPSLYPPAMVLTYGAFRPSTSAALLLFLYCFISAHTPAEPVSAQQAFSACQPCVSGRAQGQMMGLRPVPYLVWECCLLSNRKTRKNLQELVVP